MDEGVLEPVRDRFQLLFGRKAAVLHIEQQVQFVRLAEVDVFLHDIVRDPGQIATIGLGFGLGDRGNHLVGHHDRLAVVDFLIGECLIEQ